MSEGGLIGDLIGEKQKSAAPSIQYPTDGAIIALDPDVPEPLQRVGFKASQGTAGYRWYLNGQPAGGVAATHFWKPALGSHTLSLQNMAGEIADRIKFQVR